MSYLAVLAVSLFINFVIILIAKKCKIMMDCENSCKPQRFHLTATPRVGGISIMSAALFMLVDPLGRMILLASLPVFFIGLFEDLSGAVSPKIRLLFMTAGAVIAVMALDVLITQIDFIKLPYYFAMAFTLFSLVGVTNSINIIDGLHGLASGASIVALFALFTVAYSVGDYQLGRLIIIMTFAVCGFFIWVYPWGKIFLGDGGAYFLGFVLGLFSILLVNRNENVSVWFPLAVLIFPIWEVIFSIFRRKVIRKGDALSADRLHLHSLLYKRTKFSNSVASGILLLIYITYQLLTVMFYKSSPVLVLFIIVFIICYHISYIKLVRFSFSVKSTK
ncbi:undecaprenyl/decaprenyl-phosphate alpha-N-acetylglucosaminyl 1-phosphate transferase [Geovibrio thiophilus]|uniref:Undecaprenyl/decaprenyl-phosphate alpha-N-acetylglucosaminyl 1-phosphate transferase n=2 Tax=Geovibrio thiophilus TaxID=139438 RepID=A0A410K1S8_9BACT|nr:undecaprenyl/decaprenyl-phosphate alpha-N-acetylglucosaminyl 1-phosphate transferase [Geovibrio thiophilus]